MLFYLLPHLHRQRVPYQQDRQVHYDRWNCIENEVDFCSFELECLPFDEGLDDEGLKDGRDRAADHQHRHEVKGVRVVAQRFPDRREQIQRLAVALEGVLDHDALVVLHEPPRQVLPVLRVEVEERGKVHAQQQDQRQVLQCRQRPGKHHFHDEKPQKFLCKHYHECSQP